jgi:hypothetical protein
MGIVEATGGQRGSSRLLKAAAHFDYPNIGASTGFMEEARGDWWRLVSDAAASSDAAIELSALSWPELPELIAFCSFLPRMPFRYVSVHGPTKALAGSDDDLAAMLEQLPTWVDAFVLHPDVLTNAPAFRKLGDRVLLENMDARKRVGTTVADLSKYFIVLPDAGFCFDIAHAASVDPSMKVANDLLDAFGERLRELHISSLGDDGRHVPLTKRDFLKFRPVLDRCREVPWIFEAPFETW